MECPKCNTENPEQAKFCPNCGARLVAVCPLCGATLPPQARFCFECGAKVGAPHWKLCGNARRRSQMLSNGWCPEFAERLLATRGQVGKECRMVTIASYP